MIRNNTLFRRLLFRFIAVILIILIVLGISIVYFFKDFYFNKRKQEIIRESQVIIEFISRSIAKNDLDSASEWLKLESKLNASQVWLVNKEGYIILSKPADLSSQGKKINSFKLDEILAGNVISERIESSRFEKPMLLVGIPINLPHSKEVTGGLLVFTSVVGINSTINQIQKMMFVFLLLAVFLAIIVAYRWSKTLATPLKQMSETAIELSEGKFDKRIEINDDSEIGTLADSMNHLSKRLESTIENLTQERNKLKYVLTGMEEGVLVIDKDKNIILFNDSIQELLHIEKDEVIGTKLFNVIETEKIKKLFKKALIEEESYQEEFTVECPNGEHRILINCTPIYIHDDQFWGVTGLFKDISERWRFEQLQKDFVANVSHELKTPLSSIKGSTEILLDGIIDSSQKRKNYLKTILEETNRLTTLVEEVLNLAELDTTNSNPKIEKINVNELIKQVESIFHQRLNQPPLNTLISSETTYVQGDLEKLKQVLLNLLDNADKFSPENKPLELGVTKEKDWIKFWVKDQGVGIPKDKLDNVWKRFFKVDEARTPNKNEGNGLGLAIVQQIIEQHQGEVFVESEVGSGSTFGFYLKRYKE
ncbi:ATP-binding protein [Sporohalobacter salinus]|uniref:ATP-binding protein n=1 Tax=Sporohalobacter salinus TaxID=1494606 RepID=UPI0019612499|nr:ATP-binding protein [Sporohalobacter salinus]MBM7622824.1 PAS domain S-box-containing protein [Sporohalobacter salinus]